MRRRRGSPLSECGLRVTVFAEQGVMCFTRTFQTEDTGGSTVDAPSFPGGGLYPQEKLHTFETSLHLCSSKRWLPSSQGLSAPEPGSSSARIAPWVAAGLLALLGVGLMLEGRGKAASDQAVAGLASEVVCCLFVCCLLKTCVPPNQS